VWVGLVGWIQGFVEVKTWQDVAGVKEQTINPFCGIREVQ